VNRRDLLKRAAAIPFLPGIVARGLAASASAATTAAARAASRVRPGDAGWPSESAWAELNQRVGGQLLKLRSPFAGPSSGGEYREAAAQLKNPYYLGDEPALTQTSGWVDAWTSRPAAYAVAARKTRDVVAAVNFAREHNLRLVVKGGGHSYQGTSDAPDSLLIWTRHMNRVSVHDAFTPRGFEGVMTPQPAVTTEAGAMWVDLYGAVTTRGGRYVQGGGCTTVGVAGLVQSGGFGSFSKRYGTAAAGLLEAEVVTADGQVRIANKRMHPDLFWGLKGGGGGSLGVVTRLTLRTRELPEYFGAVLGSIRASSAEAYRALVARAISFYHSDLFNPHWGEHMTLTRDALHLLMLFQGLEQQEAERIWAPFFDWVRAHKEYTFDEPARILTFPARHFWDGDYLRQKLPGAVVSDDRPGAPRHHVMFAEDAGEVGWFIHGYRSAWLPASLLNEGQQSRLVDALVACTRHWSVQLYFNKALAGAPPEEIEAARETATNPQVLDAFALAIIAGGGPPAYVGGPDGRPNPISSRLNAFSIRLAMDELLKVAPGAGSYVSESDYFEKNWQDAFWGGNYPRLAAVKAKYDPDGLFFVRHGVGSERWSDDGFTRRAAPPMESSRTPRN